MALILGLESSCDETAVALVRDGVDVVAARVSSQADLHARFGGVIPEIASRSHLEVLFPLVEAVLEEAEVTLDQIDAIAVTNTPGLVGCLLVGLSAAKGLALAGNLPLVPVNHVHAHIYAALMAPVDFAGGGPPPLPADAPWPLASLVVSGGHTSLYESRGPTEHRLVGRTIDDAAGEAYDKVGALLGLPYPAGPALDRLAQRGDPRALDLPRSRGPGLDFSFSGLKTAVLYALRGAPGRRDPAPPPPLAPQDVAASFQAAVVDVLVPRLLACAERLSARGLVVCGGVAANSALRARCREAARAAGLPLFLPPLALATDNAVMIAGLAEHLLAAGRTADLAVDALPRAD